MDLEITGRGTQVTAVLRQQAEAGLARIERILGPKSTAKVVLTCEKYQCQVEVAVFNPLHDFSAKCEAKVAMHQEHAELEAALSQALQKVEAQVLKSKKRMITMQHHPEQDATGSVRLQNESDDLPVDDIDPDANRLAQAKTGVGKDVSLMNDDDMKSQSVAVVN